MTTRTPIVAAVRLWGHRIGAVAWDADTGVSAFEYAADFRRSGVQLAPLTMPPGSGLWRFPELSHATYRGLPGMLADSLPDRFGNLLINRWLTAQGRSFDTFSPVEQLCYIGSRGMGALEYQPALGGRTGKSVAVEIDALADLTAEVLAEKETLGVGLDDSGLEELLRVGTSAGGARAKALITWNPVTGAVRSGQAEAPPGFAHWILKFDGVGSSERDFRDPQGYGRVEYAYHLMARDAGLMVPDARLHIDGSGRAHFMARRFDRADDGEKIHMQSLSAIAHLDFNQAGAHSYEEAMSVTQRIGAPPADVSQLYRRMVFNVVARNQDDHTKNIAYLMTKDGRWRLSPAFDVIWAYNPGGTWTRHHQMTINGKRNGFTPDDLTRVGRRFGIRDPKGVIEAVTAVVAVWPRYADEAEVPGDLTHNIERSLRLGLG